MVLGELNLESTLNNSNKRKYDETRWHDGDVVKRQVTHTAGDKENHRHARLEVTVHQHKSKTDNGLEADLRSPVSETSSASQETLADAPDSSDTIPDPNLPSSSNTGQDAHPITPPQSTIKLSDSKHQGLSSTESAQTMASRMKCRLKLAMYKMQYHKEDLNYKRLLPRDSPVRQIGALPTPSSQRRPASRPVHRAAMQTPAPVTSVVSNERSMPPMQRSSSGDAALFETPIRNNYDLGLSSPPASQETLQLFVEPRLPDVDNTKSNREHAPILPPISDLTARVDARQQVRVDTSDQS